MILPSFGTTVSPSIPCSGLRHTRCIRRGQDNGRFSPGLACACMAVRRSLWRRIKDRRESLGIFGTAIVGLVARSTGRAETAPGQPGHNDKAHEECMKACNSCADMCAETFHDRDREVTSGKKEHAGALRLVADCEGFCRLSASMVARQSPFMAYACAACADACRDCARECDKFDAPTMKDCAAAVPHVRGLVPEDGQGHGQAGPPRPLTARRRLVIRMSREDRYHNRLRRLRHEERDMRGTQQLHDAGQSLWLDNITRSQSTGGTLRRYIEEFSVTGLTSNPTIFDYAIKDNHDYDDAIRRGLKGGKSGEALFFDLALEDLTQAADLFRPVYDKTDGRDGWVSLEVSPLLAHDTAGTVAAAKELHARAGRPNLFIKIPGTREGLPAIEDAIFAGVPVNVTLLFSREHYVAAAEAYLRGIERRVAAGLKPDVSSVASVFISRWDVAVTGKAPERLRDRLGIAIARRTYKAYRDLLDSPRSQRALNAGARPQRLLWASTGTKDPKASDVLYVKALAAPFTIDTIPEKTLKAFADHGEVGPLLPADGGDCEEVLAEFAAAGIDIDALAAQLQDEGAKAFVKSWSELLASIASKGESLKDAG